MFLTKMVREFINTIKNSNQHQNYQKNQQQQQSNQTRSGNSGYKSSKKSGTTKKAVAKCESLKNNKDIEKEKEEQPFPSTSKVFENRFKTSKAVVKAAAQTKVKSASWKRSEKSINPYNATLTANKKSRTLRKRSPTWLPFPNSNKVKLQDLNTPPLSNEQTSSCRPGTLYSDVLFGAGCSNRVKVKNITPNRTNCTTAQKKLTKALQKFASKEQDTTDDDDDDDEVKTKQFSFPSLNKANNKLSSPTLTNSTVESETVKTTVSLETISNREFSLTTETSNTTSTPLSSPTKNITYEDEADVVILSDLHDGPTTNKDVSYGHYLEQQCLLLENSNTESATPSKQDKRFLVSSICNIPKWNFMDADTKSDAFPKFLGQFDDENYLKAEKMAWLGLKLALDNNSTPTKYKLQ